MACQNKNVWISKHRLTEDCMNECTGEKKGLNKKSDWDSPLCWAWDCLPFGRVPTMMIYWSKCSTAPLSLVLFVFVCLWHLKRFNWAFILLFNDQYINLTCCFFIWSLYINAKKKSHFLSQSLGKVHRYAFAPCLSWILQAPVTLRPSIETRTWCFP